MTANANAEKRRLQLQYNASMQDLHAAIARDEVSMGSEVKGISNHAVIPFFVHPSHDSLYAGGFVACTKCGCTVSQPTANDSLRIARTPPIENRPKQI